MIERKSWVAFGLAALLMLGGVAASEALKPRQSMADMKPKLVLAELVPPSFGVWREVRSMQPVMPDPTVQAIIDMTYSEVLARAYVNDLGQVVMLTIAAVCTLCLCVNYLHLQSSITASIHGVELLEAKLEHLKTENNALEMNINTSVDLDHVYKVATEELGMVYANKDQILHYDKTESEYVRQNEDIPKH